MQFREQETVSRLAAPDAAPPRWSRSAVALLRVPPRLYPIPGWFPLVVERLERFIALPSGCVEAEINGAQMQLDLGDYIQRRIYFHSHEPHETALFRRVLRRGDVVLDVGAHVGYFTILAGSLVGREGQVHAFEPVPSNFSALEMNVARNSMRHVLLNRVAVSGGNGVMTLGLHPDRLLGTGHASAMYSKGGSELAVTVPAVTLDDYIEDHVRDSRIRLVKLDVEGLEASALAGFHRTLASRPPDVLVVEINPDMLSRNGRSVDDVTGPLRASGFEIFVSSIFGRLKEWDNSDTAQKRHMRLDRVLTRIVPNYELREALFNVVAVRRAIVNSVV